jgi:hypothetical protein
MSLTRKDGLATALAVLVALVYLSNSQDWGVPLLTSNRWATGAILVLGMGMCALGQASTEEPRTFAVTILSLLGAAALAFAVIAFWTDAQWALALLALDTIVLYAGATLRHLVEHPTHRPHPA